jgi:hypothetical protein
MPGAQVRRRGDYDLEVTGVGLIHQENDLFIAPDEVLRAASGDPLRWLVTCRRTACLRISRTATPPARVLDLRPSDHRTY